MEDKKLVETVSKQQKQIDQLEKDLQQFFHTMKKIIGKMMSQIEFLAEERTSPFGLPKGKKTKITH